MSTTDDPGSGVDERVEEDQAATSPRKVFLAIPQGYFDLHEDDQIAVTRGMARELQRQLGLTRSDSVRSKTEDEDEGADSFPSS